MREIQRDVGSDDGRNGLPSGRVVGVMNVVGEGRILAEGRRQRGQAQQLGEAGEQENPSETHAFLP